MTAVGTALPDEDEEPWRRGGDRWCATKNVIHALRDFDHLGTEGQAQVLSYTLASMLGIRCGNLPEALELADMVHEAVVSTLLRDMRS